ncbi:uncharacterized protein K444DRAFT_568912 [Hyaloscypha bicolor E]|uniref:Uncharacterized protein n=1 Tax=Hyaloscypha bicolor E TaxID=1095630 RepID=A0A2J6SWG8_9HELO|nr:uncharacterized protein K444DRAFT_568912 [Hyaloscypha bicolor E]PMD55003.1 hypothetical protein K444DRAFT_568912 [Hyaloscypha bicolor E]
MEQTSIQSRAVVLSSVGAYERFGRHSEAPSCIDIRHSKKCRHTGLRLRWPNANDNRRSIVGKSPKNKAAAGCILISESRFVHMFPWDIEMHYRVTAISPPDLGLCLPWNPQKLEISDRDLIQHFHCSAAQALATFRRRPSELSSFLLRMCLSSDSLSATALLRALLAFSSLHRHGLQEQAVELKISALKALAAASEGVEFDTEKIVQHVAAGMLLYSFEIQTSTSTSGDWTNYICGVKEVIKTVNLKQIIEGREDIECLRDWVCYNDIMTRFTLRHWVKDPEVPLTPPKISYEVNYVAPSTEPILELLSQVYDSVPRDITSIPISDDYKEYLKILHWRIRKIITEDTADEAFVIATSIYLYRLSSPFIDDQQKKDALVLNGFNVLSRLDSCELQFPVFILGCEARTDCQRGGILDLISRTEGKIGSRSFKHVKAILEGIWAQNDLVDGPNGEISYWNGLRAAMSRYTEPPCFA